MSGLSVDPARPIPLEDTVPLETFVKQPSKRRFAIPFNQRPWVWKSNNLGDLWADLQKTVGKYFEWNAARGAHQQRPTPTGNPHYFGAFVFYERNEDLYEVVDGQQRLTSVSMLAAVLRELAQEVSERSTSNLSQRNRANGMVTSLTAWLLSDPAQGVPRLSLDQVYADLYQSYVVEPYTNKDRQTAYAELDSAARSLRAQRHIHDGFNVLRKLVIDKIGDLPDNELLEHIRTLESTLGEAFIATRIVVSDEPFALSVFGGLNARGVPLSAADQIKNELFERTPAEAHPQIKQDWDAIVATVPGGSIEHFLRQRYLAFVDDDCPKNKLYFRIRDNELDPKDPAVVIARWREDAALLSMLTIQKAHPQVKGELQRQLRTLHETLGITYSWPLLLSAARRFFSSDLETFQKLARLTLAFCFRVLTIGKADVGELERSLSLAAIELTEGASSNEIARILREASDDDDFEKAFAVAADRRAKIQFYALFEIETYRAHSAGQTLEPFPHSPWQHVEHILPKNLSRSNGRLEEWAEWRSASDPLAKSEEHAEYVNRLGNLLILEAEINSQVLNYDFDAKRSGAYPGSAATFKGVPRKSYEDSKLSLVKDLCDRRAYRSWTARTIEKRQQLLAQEAVKAWTLRLK